MTLISLNPQTPILKTRVIDVIRTGDVSVMKAHYVQLQRRHLTDKSTLASCYKAESRIEGSSAEEPSTEPD